jgi:hypothetical protein
MITARPVLIRAGSGVIRVLRLHADAGGIWPLAYEVHPDEDMCRVCGCTNLFGCTPRCYQHPQARHQNGGSDALQG